MSESTTNCHVEPLKEAKQETSEEHVDDQRNEKTYKKNEVHLFSKVTDLSMLKIYEELLKTKKRSVQLEQQIHNLRKEPAAVEKTQNDVRTTSHHLKEQPVIIAAQSQRIKEFEEEMKAQFEKFKEILDEMTVEGKTETELKEIIEKQNELRMQSEKMQNQLNKFGEILDKNSKHHEKEMEILKQEILKEFQKEIKNQLDQVQKTNNDAMKEYTKTQNKENKTNEIKLTKLAEFLVKTSKKNENDIQDIKNQLMRIEKKNNEADQRVQKELKKFGDDQKIQMNTFLNEVKKQMVMQSIPTIDQRKRPADSSVSTPPAKKQSVVSTVRVVEAEKMLVTKSTVIASAMIPSSTSLCPNPPIKNESAEMKEETVEAKPAKCIFCDVFGHESVKCTRFRTNVQRKLKLRERNICIRCLEPNNFPMDGKHYPCPKADEKCPNCVDKWPNDKDMINHHSVICRINALPAQRSEHIHLPQRDVNRVYCIFCNKIGHHSMDCRVFLYRIQRLDELEERKICFRCLQPNNINNGKEHDPCPNADKPCPNCVDEYPGIRKMTHHHLLLCERMPSPDELEKINQTEAPRHHH